MKRNRFFRLVYVLIASFVFVVSCGNPVGGNSGFSLADYQNVGASVAAKEWTENYDCSNFAVQFYQNCYEAGLPCRIRTGISGGEFFEIENHAWNSVKINGKWLNWEPQINDVYNGHRQTFTPRDDVWGTWYEEDLSRMLYEYIGRSVPESMINLHEIDAQIYDDSAFYPFFIPESYCLSDDQSAEAQAIVAEIEAYPLENDRGVTVFFDTGAFCLIFKYGNKIYSTEDLRAADPLEGRSIIAGKSIAELVKSGEKITIVDVDISYKKCR